MERSKALEAAQVLLDLEHVESFLDEVVSERGAIDDLPDEMYNALYSFAKDWVEKYKQKLADL
jgi:hypothetical protein